MAIEVNGLTVKREKDEILIELRNSVTKGNVLGIFVDGQEEMVTTSVVEVNEADPTDPIIHLQKADLHGYMVEKNPIKLSKIKSVIRFKTLYSDPVYVRIRERKGSNNLAA